MAVRHHIPELLAPAGTPDAFRAALAAGADAIYCALGNDFNARRSAENFTPKTFETACREAHLAGTRVYVTINVVIKDDEMGRALALVREAWSLGADAFIIQDWGLLSRVRAEMPEVECHISTQANVHDARGAAWCRDLGASRVTLSRELSLAEIATIAKEGVELECFGHGALCFCYSGVCLMSSMRGGRSANRGLCAQPCRLPYELVDEAGAVISAPDRGRPLCPRDFCTVDDLERMRDAGVGSLKVEGRMKAPDYVHAVVSVYREALDDLAAGRVPELGVDASRRERLKRAFNRDFTNAYLDGASGDEMMSYERSNNRGQVVGEVVSTRDLGSRLVRRGGSEGGRERMRRITEAEVAIRLTERVGEGDLLEVRPVDDPSAFLTTRVDADAAPGETILCSTARPMPPGSVVRVIRSQEAFDAVDAALSREVARRRPVGVRIVCRLGRPFCVELSCEDGTTGRAEGFVVEPARTKAVTKDDLVEHVGRMGSTPFAPVSFDVEMDEGCGMGFSSVHKVRAAACDALEAAILEPYCGRVTRGQVICHTMTNDSSPCHAPLPCRTELCALVKSPEAALAAAGAGATRIYATADDLDMRPDAWPDGVIPWLDEVCREHDHARLDQRVTKGRPVAVGNVSELALAAERGAKPEVRPCIPVHNTDAVSALERAGAAGFWLSPELTLDEVIALAPRASVPVGLVVYGRARTMTSEHCVLQAADRCAHDCASCALRRRDLRLRNIDGQLMPVRTDVHGRSRIYDARPTDAMPQVPELIRAGVSRLMVDGTLLAPSEVARQVSRVAAALRAFEAGGRPSPREEGSYPGHLFSPIG